MDNGVRGCLGVLAVKHVVRVFSNVNAIAINQNLPTTGNNAWVKLMKGGVVTSTTHVQVR